MLVCIALLVDHGAMNSVYNAPINVLPHLPPYWQKMGI